MNQPHYLRVARALALVVIVPGCTGAVPTPDPQNIARADDAGVSPPDAPTTPQVDAARDVDANYPFSSGPIVPPELPVGFA